MVGVAGLAFSARAWEAAASAMQKLGVPQSRIDHLLKQDNPALVAEVVKELEGKA